MISVTLSIGSNCDNRDQAVKNAIEWLKSILIEGTSSRIYETSCAGKTGKPYTNAVMKGFFNGDAFQLNDIIKNKEHEMGRTPKCRENGDVPIDIDIVICNGTIFKEWDYRQKFFKIGYEELGGAPD